MRNSTKIPERPAYGGQQVLGRSGDVWRDALGATLNRAAQAPAVKNVGTQSGGVATSSMQQRITAAIGFGDGLRI